METATSWTVASIVPEPRMPHDVNQDFTLTLVPGGKVHRVVSERPAFAKVRNFHIVASEPDKVVIEVAVHGMSAGTLDVPFLVEVGEGGVVEFTIRTIG